MRLHSVTLAFAVSLLLIACGPAQEQTAQFQIEETTIAEIQAAILRGELTSTQVVELYLARIKAYNGTCVDQPEGILGAITTIPRAGKVNALITLNLRPAERLSRGFDERKARSMTNGVDDDPGMPDALEVAEQQDAYFASTGRLIGPLHGVVMAIKDQFDTFDMRTTSGADAFYAALHDVCRELALLVVRDGEGAQKFIEIAVTGAADDASARRVGLADTLPREHPRKIVTPPEGRSRLQLRPLGRIGKRADQRGRRHPRAGIAAQRERLNGLAAKFVARLLVQPDCRCGLQRSKVGPESQCDSG